MKKIVSLLLALIFFSQAMPMNVLAEAVNPVPTNQELSAAVALTGLSDSAPGYRSGMAPSESMSAMQLAGWIHEFQDQKLGYIMDTFENYDVELAYVKEHYPSTFGMLKSYSGAGIGRLYDEYSEAKAWRDDVHYYDDLLTSTAYRIDVLAEYLQSGEMTEREQTIYAYEMRDKWRTLEALIPEIVERAKMWTQEYDRLETLLTGPYEFSGSDESLAWLLEEVDNLRGMDSRAAERSFSVSASAVRVAPDQTVMTRLARLSPISGALADSDQKMNVRILDDKNFGITLLDGETRVSGATVYVNEEGKKVYSDDTNGSGGVIFPIRNFKNDSDGEALVNLKIVADGYRRLEAPGVWVKKGAALNVPMQKDDGNPYLVTWSFWGHDMQAAQYTVITSPINDTKQPIALTVSSPGDYHLKVYFTNKKGQEPVAVGEADGKKGEQSFTFEGQWLKDAPAEGKLFAEITCGGKTQTYQAQIVLKASVLKKPVSDPNTKSLLNPGIQFTLPDGWVKPLGGLKINIDLPVDDKFKVRGYIDLNGSGAITIGTKILEDASKELTQNWKTKDQKALDKAVKKAKGEGYMAETKAKNGGDWAGRSKWSPLKLGKISLDISFFAFAQIQYTDDGYNYGRVFGKGGAGFTATLKGTYTLMWPVAQLSVSLGVTFTIFPEVGIMVDTYWPDDAQFPQFKKFEYVKGALNIIIRIELCIEALAGLKGVASLSVRGIGYLEFAIRSGITLDLDGIIEEFKQGKFDPSKHIDPKKEKTIYAGGSVDVILEIFWAKAVYALLDPPIKYMLYPEFKRISDSAPKSPVDRFIAAFLSSAQAAEDTAAQEGGGQVDTDNRDLVINGQLMETWNTGTDKTEVFTMRPAGSDTPEPMMLYIQQQYSYGSERYSRPILVGTPLNKTHYTPLTCQNGQSGDSRDHYMPADGYDVIDFDYFVSDVADAGLKTKDGGKISDVLFTVCILAKDYETQVKVYEDGTREERKVPLQTWAYVRMFYLDQGSSSCWLEPLVLPGQTAYTAECFDLTGNVANNPTASPSVCGAIDRNSKDHLIVAIWLYTQPLNVQAGKKAENMMMLRAFSPDAPEIGEAYIIKALKDYEDFFAKKRLSGVHFFRAYSAPLNILYNGRGISNSFYAMAQDTNSEDYVYDLAYKMESNHNIRVVAKNVVSFAARGFDLATRYYHRAFFVQRTEDGEGFRLMSAIPINREDAFKWVVRDYDVPMPATDIHWTELYGRECLYWLETAGEAEDGKGSLFRVRGAWYDDAADSFSEPFAIATLKTPAKDSYPTWVYLADHNEGYYAIRNDAGKEQLYRFNFKLVTGLKLVGNVLTETLPQPGSYDDMLLTVYNNGNVPISGLDIVAYHEQSGKAAESFETIHLDILHPDRNSVVLNKGLEGAKENRYGQTVAREEPSSLSYSDEDYRCVQDSTCRGYPIRVLEQTQKMLKSKLLMPGKFTAFNISLLIPQNWEGSHSIYLQVDRFYTAEGSSFQTEVNGQNNNNNMLLMFAAAPGEKIVSIGRDGSVRRENGGGMLMLAARGNAEEQEDLSMYKDDITFDSIQLDSRANDLSIQATRWDNNGEPMVTLTLTNWAHIGASGRSANTVVMEAFLDEETAPVFRYSLPDEVSDKETWNFDMPLSLLTGGRSASKVTVKVSGKNYKEVGDVDNSVEILLESDTLSFLSQPQSQNVPLGGEASFRAAATGGRMPYRYQWQVKTGRGAWADIPGENTETLILKAVTKEMNGSQYRLVVTDASGYMAQSSPASLTVKDVPLTGDTAPILVYALGLAAALGTVAYIVFRRRKEEQASR